MKKMRAFRLGGTVLAAILAIVVLFPFYLVIINSCKNANDIVANPIEFFTASFDQLITNLTSVMNNSNFNFWYAFASSLIITVVSLLLLILLGGMGHLPQQDQMVHGHLHDLHRLHDHSLPGGHAAADLHLP